MAKMTREEELAAIEAAMKNPKKFQRIEDPEQIIAHNEAREAAGAAERKARAKRASSRQRNKPGRKAELQVAQAE